MMVKLGMKSVPGNISSIKLPIPPNTPLTPPNVIIKMIEEIGGAPRVIATGGLASLIATGSEFIELVDDTLTLEGLRLIYEKSRTSQVESPKSA